MMRKTLLACILLLFGLNSYAQQHDFKLLVGLRMRDCINCYNNDLDKIDQHKEDVGIILVLGQAYAIDSDKIIKKYNLHDITRHIIWSDSLLNSITGNGPSAIEFTSKYHTLSYRFGLKGLPKYLLSYIQGASQPFDSLLLNYPHVALGASRNFYVNDGKVYFVNSILDEINGYDLLSQEKVLHFEITDSLLDVTFPFSGLPVSLRKVQHDILRHAHMSTYKIEALAFDKDTVYARFVNNYFIVKEDTILKNDNIFILKIINGKINNIYRYPYCFSNTLDSQRVYCAGNIILYHYHNALYNGIYTGLIGHGSAYANYHVLGRFEPGRDNKYKLTWINPMRNPEIYDNTLDCEQLMFDQDYFLFPLIDTLYSITGKLPPIPLNFIPKNIQDLSARERCMHGIDINAFKISKEYVWVVFYDTTGRERIIKHNRNTGKNQYSKIVFNNSSGGLNFNFDPVDPDYVLYTTTSGGLYRLKVF